MVLCLKVKFPWKCWSKIKLVVFENRRGNINSLLFREKSTLYVSVIQTLSLFWCRFMAQHPEMDFSKAKFSWVKLMTPIGSMSWSTFGVRATGRRTPPSCVLSILHMLCWITRLTWSCPSFFFFFFHHVEKIDDCNDPILHLNVVSQYLNMYLNFFFFFLNKFILKSTCLFDVFVLHALGVKYLRMAQSGRIKQVGFSSCSLL